MVHCWKCGVELRSGARFCDACGARMSDAPYAGGARPEGEVLRSAKYFVGQNRVNAAISMIFGGIFFLGFSFIAPSWAPNFSLLAALMGLGCIGMGVAYWFLSHD